MKEIFGFLIICILSMFTTVEVALTEEVSSDKPIRSLKASESILSLSFSPDGKILASGSINGEIKRWNVAIGEEQLNISGHENGVKSLAFSPDGKLLASVGGIKIRYEGAEKVREGKGNVILWDINTGEKLRVLPGRTDIVHSVFFSRNGKLLASEWFDKLCIIWDVNSGKELYKIEGALGITFNSNSEPLTLLRSNGDYILKLLTTNREWGKTYRAGDLIRRPIAFSPNAEKVALIETKKKSMGVFQEFYNRIWNIATGESIKIFDTERLGLELPSPLAFNLDGKLLAGPEGDIFKNVGVIRIWDAQTGDEIRKLTSGYVYSLAFSPKGDILASGHDGEILLWDVSKVGE